MGRRPTTYGVLFNFPLTRVLYLAEREAVNHTGNYFRSISTRVIAVSARMRLSATQLYLRSRVSGICINKCSPNLRRSRTELFIGHGILLTFDIYGIMEINVSVHAIVYLRRMQRRQIYVCYVCKYMQGNEFYFLVYFHRAHLMTKRVSDCQSEIIRRQYNYLETFNIDIWLERIRYRKEDLPQ